MNKTAEINSDVHIKEIRNNLRIIHSHILKKTISYLQETIKI